MKIISPSYKRAEKGLAITHELIKEVHYVVAEKEAEKYKLLHDKVIAIPNEVQGSKSRVMNYILDNEKDEHICFVDDDLKAFYRWEHTERIKMDEESIYEFIEHGFVLCEEMGFKFWGANCLTDKGSYREYTPFTTTAFISGQFHCHIKHDVRFDPVLGSKDDFDFSIAMMDKYRGALRINYAHVVGDMHGVKGGHAEKRTLKRELDLNVKLQKKWGARIVKFDEGNSQVQRKRIKNFDINPIVKVPINGV